ncbi:hypothetical protein ES702_07064 [subsurface metagenome]
MIQEYADEIGVGGLRSRRRFSHQVGQKSDELMKDH